MEAPAVGSAKNSELAATIRIAILILVGYLAFELIPTSLDKGLDTEWNLKTSFFLVSFAVFINIHHFFIDSVVWKFDQPEVRRNLLGAAS